MPLLVWRPAIHQNVSPHANGIDGITTTRITRDRTGGLLDLFKSFRT